MSDYNKATDFAAKDALSSGDPDKIIKGTPIDDEYNAIATAIASKADKAGPTFTGTATFANLDVTVTADFGGATIADLGTVATVDLNGGTIDGTTIGATTPAAGAFTTVDGIVGSVTPAAINATTVGASGTITGNLFSGSGASLTAVDAATLDSIDSSQFLRSDTADTMTAGSLTMNDSVAVKFGTGGAESEIRSDASNTIWDMFSGGVQFYNSATQRIAIGSGGNLNLVTGELQIAGTAQTTGFKLFRTLTQAVYDGLTPDADTIYFING